MLYYLHHLADQFSPLYVFYYITPRAGGACLTAFLLSLMIGNFVIRKLVSLKFGQPIRTAEEVHKLYELHEGKGGTPTMGGVMILGTIVVSTLLWAKIDNPFIMTLMVVLVSHGLLGLADDYHKVTKGSSDGVSAWFKLAVQFGSALAAGCFLYFNMET